MIEAKVGNRIKDLRNKLGISQEELGFRSGVHRTYIASLEVGKRNISIATLEKIVIALEVTLSEFFDF
ncbi:helix-turn-helix domain-containing protein [Pumilibacter muris]|uniref:helix-turn-helix domain-containing protein n=1 Tax=Pumilibacter muris TaxID=2941510 RepID=UPI00203E9E3C|nr:helix-turn-helix transcriptional regulator [Pumilibacter muris]